MPFQCWSSLYPGLSSLHCGSGYENITVPRAHGLCPEILLLQLSHSLFRAPETPTPLWTIMTSSKLWYELLDISLMGRRQTHSQKCPLNSRYIYSSLLLKPSRPRGRTYICHSNCILPHSSAACGNPICHKAPCQTHLFQDAAGFSSCSDTL